MKYLWQKGVFYMILAIDMGNTNTVIGGIDEEKTYFIERVTTDQNRTDTEYAVAIKNVLEMHQIHSDSIEGAILFLCGFPL